MQRPFFSQSPYRTGSRPSRPPISGGAPGASGAGSGAGSGTCLLVDSPIILGFTTAQVQAFTPMPDQLPAWCALPGHAVVTLEGRDALAFAHAQFMNDSRPLADGQWQWSGWLSPKGRVLALFVFLRRGPECAWLVLPDADAQGFADALKRFVFRSKVAIDVRDDLHVSGCFGDIGACGSGGSREALIPFAASAAPTDMRMIRISEEPGVPDDDAVARWTIADLRAGIPRLPASQHDK